MGFGPSPMEIAVIAVIALIVLGPQKLPEAARSLGKGFREMRDSFSGEADSREHLDEYEEGEDEDDDEFADEGEPDQDYTPDMPEQDAPTQDSSSDQESPAKDTSSEADHQKEARSSVPSASSSSTERE